MKRIGLVGFGKIAESAHFPAWLELPEVEVTAIADSCPERRQVAATLAPRARVYASCAELLAEESPDCLDICTPPHDHTPSILLACACRVPRIVCEKPMTSTREDYQRILVAQSMAGNQIYTINSWLQSDLHRFVTRILAEGTIGEIRHVTLRTLRPDCALGVESWRPRWRTDPAYAGGGIVLDHGWHQLYLMARWIGDHPLAVDATLRTIEPRHAPVEDWARLEIAFPRAHGSIELSWAAPSRANDGEIVGTNGTIAIHDDGLVVSCAGSVERHPYGERLSDSSYHPEWFQALFATILDEEQRQESGRNLREAAMLVDTLFRAYDQEVASTGQQTAGIN